MQKRVVVVVGLGQRRLYAFAITGTKEEKVQASQRSRNQKPATASCYSTHQYR